MRQSRAVAENEARLKNKNQRGHKWPLFHHQPTSILGSEAYLRQQWRMSQSRAGHIYRLDNSRYNE